MPALLALVLAMFSLESQPKPLPQGLAADVLFEGDLAAARAERIVDSGPSRRAGSPGDRATGELVARAMARRGFRVERDAFTHAGRRLVNVVASRAGRSRRQLVLVAARDARGSPDTARQRRRHGRPDGAGAGVPGPADAPDARARLGGRRHAGRGGGRAARPPARRPRPRRDRARDVRPRRPHTPRIGDRAVVERHRAQRDRAPAHRGGLDPRGARPAGGEHRRRRPALPACLPARDRVAGPVPGSRPRGRANLGQRRAAARRPGRTPSTATGWGVSGAPPFAQSRRSTRAAAPRTGRTPT